jgi:4'-phosphopantetheinyl transferase
MGAAEVVWVRSEERDAADRLLRRLAAVVHGQAVTVGRLCPRCASPDHGRPYLRGWHGARPAAVSLSRTSGTTVVAMWPQGQVGVDVERVDRFTDPGIAAVLLHADEPAARPADLARTWVRKEALLKASGTGLSVDPRSVRLDASDGPPRVVRWPEGVPGPGWVVDLGLADGLVAALAGQGTAPPRDVRVRRAGPGAPRG